MAIIDMFGAMMNEEFNDFRKVFESVKDDAELDLVNEQGDVIIPCIVDRDKIESINGTFAKYDSEYSSNYISYYDLYKSISDRVKIAKNLDTEKAILLAIKTLTKRAEDSTFAGILLINRESGFVFNPLHPINLYLLLNNKVKKLPEKLDVFIFDFIKEVEFNEEFLSEALKVHTAYHLMFTQSMVENLEYKMEVIDYNKDFNDITMIKDTNSNIRVEKEISKNFNSIVFPLQVISTGELLPYMGWGAITKNIKAINTLGCVTGNLKCFHYSSDNSVCTGNKSNESVEGWYTLSKINANSTWFDYYLHKNYREFFAAGYILAKEIALGNM